MALWKQLLLHAYYPASLPLRDYRTSRRVSQGKAPVVVLLFHRVAPDWANEWTTHTAIFVRGMYWLKQHFEMVSLSEAQRRVREGYSEAPCVAITFDDGYASNSEVALPLLVEEGIPCTYFVTTEAILEGKPFEHDLKMGHDFRPHSLDDLRRWADRGIEIGAHTRTHVHFGEVTERERMLDEIVTARDELQAALQHPLPWFAVPFGHPEHLSDDVFQIAHDAGYQGVVSAYGGYNFPGGDPFHLQRCGCDGPLIRLKNWATVDPMKELRIKRFEYQLHDASSAREKALA